MMVSNDIAPICTQASLSKYSFTTKHCSVWAEIFLSCTIFIDNLPGQFIGFDESEPTSESGGKALVVGLVKQKYDT